MGRLQDRRHYSGRQGISSVERRRLLAGEKLNALASDLQKLFQIRCRCYRHFYRYEFPRAEGARPRFGDYVLAGRFQRGRSHFTQPAWKSLQSWM